MTLPTYLLVDDDVDDLEIFALAMEDICVPSQLITAQNGLAALSLFSDNPGFSPDFIFIDLNMPLMNGKQFLAAIKAMNDLKSTIIIYTTSSHPRDIKETESLGASHYLVKPSNIDKLSKILHKIFSKQPLPYLLHQEIKDLIV